MEFDLPVKGSKVKLQQVTALHLFCGLAFTGSGAIIYVYNFDITYWGLALLIGGILLIALTIAKNKWIVTRSANTMMRSVELLVSLAILSLSVVEQWKFPMGIFGVLSAAIVFAMYWERLAGQQMYVHLDEGGIKMPVTSRKRQIAWHETDQVLLRYSVLSIEGTGNRLFQVDVSAEGVDTAAFELFCNNMIAANEHKKIKNDW